MASVEFAAVPRQTGDHGLPGAGQGLLPKALFCKPCLGGRIVSDANLAQLSYNDQFQNPAPSRYFPSSLCFRLSERAWKLTLGVTKLLRQGPR